MKRKQNRPRDSFGRFVVYNKWSKKAIQALLLARRRINRRGCWVWPGRPNPTTGYGRLTVAGNTADVHRLAAWIWFNLPLHTGQVVCVLHRCDNRACYNPKHLFTGTLGDNVRDMVAKGRSHHQRRTKCLYGHPLDYKQKTKTGWARCCLTCKRRREREGYARRKKAAQL